VVSLYDHGTSRNILGRSHICGFVASTSSWPGCFDLTSSADRWRGKRQFAPHMAGKLGGHIKRPGWQENMTQSTRSCSWRFQMCNFENVDFIDKYRQLFLIKQPDQKFSFLVAPISKSQNTAWSWRFATLGKFEARGYFSVHLRSYWMTWPALMTWSCNMTS